MSPIIVECHVDQVVNGIAKIVCKVGNVTFHNECPSCHLESRGIFWKNKFVCKVTSVGDHFELDIYSIKEDPNKEKIHVILSKLFNCFMSDPIDEDS